MIITIFVSCRFVLSSTESFSGAEPVIQYTGLSTEAVASSLKPFTQYTAKLEVGRVNRYIFSACITLQSQAKI